MPLGPSDLVPVMASHHAQAGLANNAEMLVAALPKLSRIFSHDTSSVDVARSEGQEFYVQSMDQKVEAILAGTGIGHLPRERIQRHLGSGALIELSLAGVTNHQSYLAWRISNQGKGLRALTRLL